ncbi:MAG: precorrin-4 C(11)-methyltransferase [Thermoleophilia bacterium]|nr:precorrin-4 C(11)-methyltransferase [Thermoleophilia bacterium]
MIWFVGAGPGDPELITVKGSRLLREADVIIYAGSLVPPALLTWAAPGAEVYDSAGMALDEIVSLMVSAHNAGRKVVRLHTGDPSLYGAIGEQMACLDRAGAPYEIVAGVSSYAAAAAAAGSELTLPGVSQTVIITRAPGRTAVPEREMLADLARHQSTMAIFLSADRMGETVASLRTHYPEETPVVAVYKAGWPGQKVVRGALGTIEGVTAEAGITRTAVILVGAVLANQGEPSKLYDRHFSHGYRQASCLEE